MTPDFLPVDPADDTWNDYATRAHQTGFAPVSPDQWAAQKASGAEVPVVDVAAPALSAPAEEAVTEAPVEAAPAEVTADDPAGPHDQTVAPAPAAIGNNWSLPAWVPATAIWPAQAQPAEASPPAADEAALTAAEQHVVEAEAEVDAALHQLTADTDTKLASPPAP